MRSIIVCSVGIILLLSGFGCAQSIALLPAPGAKPAELPGNIAEDSSAGVTVMAGGNQWTGRPAIEERLTPVRVFIENHHGSPLLIRHDNFVLAGTEGKRYAALSSPQIEACAAEIGEPSMRGYYGGPYYSPAHPFAGPSWGRSYPYWGRSYFERGYYDYYYRLQPDTEPPTEEMLAQSVTEGVLQDGESVSGFIYFEKVDPDAAQVAFTMDLIDANTNERFGTISIPFTVVKK